MLENYEGKLVPKVSFKTRANNQWKELSTDDLFANKTVVLFSLPGAFTPTCSATHLPGYNQLAKTFRENGVDSILCFSVNDAFVMDAWKQDQDAENIQCIPDGNGDFTAGMGMLVDKSEIGFGKRSWRYSALVKNGIVEKMFVEPEKAGDPFEVSDAETMLRYINPDAIKPKQVSIITREGCPYCAQAKALLKEQGLDYEELVLNQQLSPHSLKALTGRTTVPQIFIEGKLIGGADDLASYFAK